MTVMCIHFIEFCILGSTEVRSVLSQNTQVLGSNVVTDWGIFYGEGSIQVLQDRLSPKTDYVYWLL